MKFPGRKALVVALILGLGSCATGPIVKVSDVEGDLRGMVYDLDRQPVGDATVTLDIPKAPLSVVTDLHGKFGFGTVAFGPVTLKVSKAGYESLVWAFPFHAGSQVLYLQLSSADQLFSLAADSLTKRNWRDFQGYLDRAQAEAPGSLQGTILSATALELQGKPDDAIQVLDAYPAERPILAIELFLGELYSAKGDKAAAKVHWAKALAIKEDDAVRAKMDQP